MTFQQTGAPVAFVNVSDRDRALAFYRDTLGLAIRSSDGFGDFLAFNGALIRLTALPDYKSAGYPVIGWNVEDIVAAVTALRDRGIAFTRYEGLDQDDLGIWTAPDGQAKVAFFADPDGNVLSLAQA